MARIPFKDLTIGDYSGIREYKRNPEFFIRSFLPPNTFNLESISNDRNFVLIGRKGSGKSSCCLALAHTKIDLGYRTFFYNFSDELTRAELKDSVLTQSLNLSDLSTKKLFDSIVEFYDFRNLWKRRVLYSIAQDLHLHGKTSEFTRFVSSVKLKEASISEGVGRGLHIPLKSEVQDIAAKIIKEWKRCDKIALEQFNEISLTLLQEYHPEYQAYFFFDELNLSHAKSGSDEYETLIALIRDIVRASAELNDYFVQIGKRVHVVCCLRPEVRDELLARDNELSKTIDSNFVSLSWPSQARSDNPLITLLKLKLEHSHESEIDLDNMIPETVFAVPEQKAVPFPVYFLNITWYRPRDVIRVLKCYQVTNGDQKTLFGSMDDQLGFLKEYSRVSRQDIVAELEVKYSKSLIDEAFRRIRKPVFSDRGELLEYLDVLSNRLDLEELVNDLFAAGVIFNHQNVDGEVRVFASYRNDPELVDDLRVIIHRGLQTSMHLGFRLNWDSSEQG